MGGCLEGILQIFFSVCSANFFLPPLNARSNAVCVGLKLMRSSGLWPFCCYHLYFFYELHSPSLKWFWRQHRLLIDLLPREDRTVFYSWAFRSPYFHWIQMQLTALDRGWGLGGWGLDIEVESRKYV